MTTDLNISCPSCGASTAPKVKICPYCEKSLIINTYSGLERYTDVNLNKYISTFSNLAQVADNIEIIYSLALALFQLKLYERAKTQLEKVLNLEPDNADAYFMLALTLLKGKKPFSLPRSIVDRSLELVDAAIAIRQKPIYYLLGAYIRYDYFHRKKFKVARGYEEDLNEALDAGATRQECESLSELMGKIFPDELNARSL